MKKLLTLSLLTSSLLFSNEISLDSIGLNLGKANSQYSQINHTGSISLGNTPNETLNSFEVYTILKGMYSNKTLKPSLSYTYSSNDDIKNQYFLTGLNKYYYLDKLKLYAGVLLGYGELKYRYNPLNSSKDNNNDANSLIAGVQLGVQYPISNKYSFTLDTKYLVHDYETKLEPSNTAHSTLEHKSTSMFSFGVRYSF